MTHFEIMILLLLLLSSMSTAFILTNIYVYNDCVDEDDNVATSSIIVYILSVYCMNCTCQFIYMLI